MGKAKSSLHVEYEDVEGSRGGGGGRNFVCMRGGFEKSFRSREGRKNWL